MENPHYLAQGVEFDVDTPALNCTASFQLDLLMLQLEHIRVNPLDGESIDYFANGLKNEKDFKKHLRKILIPRVPGTQGSETVRNVSQL